MSSSREIVLGRIRTALANDGASTPVPRDYIRAARPAGSEQVIELLVDRLVDYKALVHQVEPTGLSGALDEALSGMASVVIAPGLDPAIAAACAGDGRTVTIDSSPQVLSPQQLDLIDAVVTEKGSAVITDLDAEQRRRALTAIF